MFFLPGVPISVSQPDEYSEAADLSASKDETAAADNEHEQFENLFSQLAVMKEHSARLAPSERKLYAEKMALAFYAAMGGDDTDDE
jgi:hypothetical protein